MKALFITYTGVTIHQFDQKVATIWLIFAGFTSNKWIVVLLIQYHLKNLKKSIASLKRLLLCNVVSTKKEFIDH